MSEPQTGPEPGIPQEGALSTPRHEGQDKELVSVSAEDLLVSLIIAGGLWTILGAAAGAGAVVALLGFNWWPIGAGAGFLLGIVAYGMVEFVKAVARGNPGLIACPACRKKVNVPEEYAGKQVICPRCGAAFTAQHPEPPPGPPPPEPRTFSRRWSRRWSRKSSPPPPG